MELTLLSSKIAEKESLIDSGIDSSSFKLRKQSEEEAKDVLVMGVVDIAEDEFIEIVELVVEE